MGIKLLAASTHSFKWHFFFCFFITWSLHWHQHWLWHSFLLNWKLFKILHFIQCIEPNMQEHGLLLHYFLSVKIFFCNKSLKKRQAQNETFLKRTKIKLVKLIWQLLCSIHKHFERKKTTTTYLPCFAIILISYVENMSLAHTFICLFDCSDSQ